MTSKVWNTVESYDKFEIILNANMALRLPTGYQKKQ